MDQTLIIEGTGAEVARVLEAMPQQRFRATALPAEGVVPSVSGAGGADCIPFYDTATNEVWARAFREWAAGHGPLQQALTDQAVGRDSIYDGRA